jgi:hypothetical protein
MNTPALLIALETLRKIRDAKAPDYIAHPDAWYEGYTRQQATDTVSLIEALVDPLTQTADPTWGDFDPLGRPD